MAEHVDIRRHSGSKYLREIRSAIDPTKALRVDVYRVLDAFDVRSPGIQHAIKKLLCAGIRGKGTVGNDVSEAIDALQSVLTLELDSTRAVEVVDNVPLPEGTPSETNSLSARAWEEAVRSQDLTKLPDYVRATFGSIPRPSRQEKQEGTVRDVPATEYAIPPAEDGYQGR